MNVELDNEGGRKTVEINANGRAYITSTLAGETVELAWEVVDE